MLNAIKNYISKVREKPESKRKALLLTWSGGLTLVIALVWFVNFNYVLYNKSVEEAELVAKTEALLERGEAVEKPLEKETASFAWFDFVKNNLAAVGEGFKVLTGQMDE